MVCLALSAKREREEKIPSPCPLPRGGGEGERGLEADCYLGTTCSSMNDRTCGVIG